MCEICEAQAAAEANRTAALRSSSLTGHGRKAHGRDASFKKKLYANEDAQQRNVDAAWSQIYEQTLNRLLKNCPDK